MKRIICILIFVSILNPLFSFSQETEGIDKHLENISGQYAECAAYYTMVYNAMNTSNEKESAKAYGQLQETAIYYSLLLASQGRSKELADKITNSRIRMYIKYMRQEADNRNENISILINKYHFDCQNAMENQPSALQAILKAMAAKEDK